MWVWMERRKPNLLPGVGWAAPSRSAGIRRSPPAATRRRFLFGLARPRNVRWNGKVEVKGVGTVGSTTLLAWWSGLHAWGQASVFLVCAGESMEYNRYSLIYLVRIECTHESWSHLMAVSLGAAAPRFRKDFPAHSFLVSSAAA